METELDHHSATLAAGAINNTRSPASVTARVDRAFDAMRRVIEAPDSRLQHYRDDFYTHDRNYLLRTCASGMYGWVIRRSGTHLIQLGRHPKMHEELIAALELTRELDCYLIDARRATVKSVSVAELQSNLMQLQYTVLGTSVRRGQMRIALIDIQLTAWSRGMSPEGIVTIESTGLPLTLDDLVALVQISQSEVIGKSQSLFTNTRSITLDGEDLFELIEQQGI